MYIDDILQIIIDEFNVIRVYVNGTIQLVQNISSYNITTQYLYFYSSSPSFLIGDIDVSVQQLSIISTNSSSNLPTRWSSFHDESTRITGGELETVSDSLQPYGYYVMQTAGSGGQIGDSFSNSFKIDFTKYSEYSFNMLCRTSEKSGIIQITFNDQIITSFDLYNVYTKYNSLLTYIISPSTFNLTSGEYTIKCDLISNLTGTTIHNTFNWDSNNSGYDLTSNSITFTNETVVARERYEFSYVGTVEVFIRDFTVEFTLTDLPIGTQLLDIMLSSYSISDLRTSTNFNSSQLRLSIERFQYSEYFMCSTYSKGSYIGQFNILNNDKFTLQYINMSNNITIFRTPQNSPQVQVLQINLNKYQPLRFYVQGGPPTPNGSINNISINYNYGPSYGYDAAITKYWIKPLTD